MRDKCKLFPSQTAKAEEGEDVELRKLKAIFFLKETGLLCGEEIEIVFANQSLSL